MPDHPLEAVLHPKSIAVVGASDKPGSRGYSYTHHLLDYGFKGHIYPVNPKYPEVLGMKAFPTVRDIPGTVDFVISCVPSHEVLNMLKHCSKKGVKGVHLFTARFSETGRHEAIELERAVLELARNLGIRLIGPNCMGLYIPGEGISFAYDLPQESGSVGMISQTGGGAAIYVNLASMRGVRFSKVISYGNGLDLTESDYLDYFAQDSETTIITMYVEGVKDGRRFLESLRHAASIKPVIVVKGGKGQAGARMTSSHTASLAGSIRTWEAAVLQAGAVSAKNFDEMADLAASFYFLPPIPGPRLGMLGGGGGPSVLAADECEEEGLEVLPLPNEIQEELKTRAALVWDWIGNPIDLSILGGSGISGTEMLEMMAANHNYDLLLANTTEVPLASQADTPARAENEVKEYIALKNKYPKPFLVVLGEKSLGIEDYDHWRWRLTGQMRTELIAAGIPVYPSVKRAARAARKLIDYYQRKG
jgi:acyl-CoA synthetase (NDP forming)